LVIMREHGEVRAAVEESLAAADLGALDAGAVAVLRTLADKIDTEAELRWAMLQWAEAEDREVRPPKEDNVSIPTFLKYCDALGLTPAARAVKAGKGKEGAGDSNSRPASGIAARRRARQQRAA
jgi:hypothetical protein